MEVLKIKGQIELDYLLQDRIDNPKNKKMIDKQIWDDFGVEKAILFTDLCGFSKSVKDKGIIDFLVKIHKVNQLFGPIVQKYKGTVIKREGDSNLVIFNSAKDALKASMEIQRILLEYNKDAGKEEPLLLCIGIGYGKILQIGNSDVFGNEVNLASKLGEDFARAFEILISENAYRSIGMEIEEVEECHIEGYPRVAFKMIFE